jgi:trimethylamine--corrinoid protein Co-methyltransferase
VSLHVRTVVARDMEGSRDLDINSAYAAMASATKPIGTSFFEPQHVHEVAEMFNMALTGDPHSGAFRQRPFCMANNTFVVPPLCFAEDSTLCMAEQVRVGMPINLLSAGQAGASSPAALAGSLVQALAECLAALTCVNLMSPGHPCIMGMWPFVSDLRTGAMSSGSGEEAVLNAASAQLLNWIGLPSGVAAMVTDNDMLGSINRTIHGSEVDDAMLSVEVIRDVGNGVGHFLGHQQTLDLMLTEYIFPIIGDRNSPEDWKDAGATSAPQRAHKYVNDVLAGPLPSHIPADIDAAIRERYDIQLPSQTPA